MPNPSPGSRDSAEDFLTIASDFDLGDLVTELAHPRSLTLSQTARGSTAAGLAMLFDVDRDVLERYDEWSRSGQPARLAEAVLSALGRGGRVFFTGCGATGRLSIQLDAAWRTFWRRRRRVGLPTPSPDEWEDRTRSVMAGGDYALIKSVEGFEDFAPFGRKQIADLGVAPGDVVFAITEGGETSFVIGTAWQGLESGARVFFVYNNPDEVLRAHVRRSREVLDEAGIEKVNLTTGPMAVTGSTRMQATSIQLLAMLTVLEMVVRDLLGGAGGLDEGAHALVEVPSLLAAALADLHAELTSPRVLGALGAVVEAEARVYGAGARCSYLAGALGVDVLTDTTERSPTYCTPPFRKWDDERASDSWAFLFTPEQTTEQAWTALLGRRPQTLEWTGAELNQLLDANAAARQAAVLGEIRLRELMRFRIGLDGIRHRPPRRGDGLTAVVSEQDTDLLAPGGAFAEQLAQARAAGAWTAVVGIGRAPWITRLEQGVSRPDVDHLVTIRLPGEAGLLDPLLRIAAKLLLNSLSTCTMVRLGRVLGNRMIWVVPSNLKLIDRATRYIRDLADVPYETACRTLFDVMEYVDSRRQAGLAYPAPVGVAVMRLRHGLGLCEAEARLNEELQAK